MSYNSIDAYFFYLSSFRIYIDNAFVNFIERKRDFSLWFAKGDKTLFAIAKHLTNHQLCWNYCRKVLPIRPFTVGRKNWLFSDTPKGAEASATVYTMVEMAKAHGLNIYKYLEYLLENRPTSAMSDEQLEKFSPWNEAVKTACGTEKVNNLEMRN